MIFSLFTDYNNYSEPVLQWSESDDSDIANALETAILEAFTYRAVKMLETPVKITCECEKNKLETNLFFHYEDRTATWYNRLK